MRKHPFVAEKAPRGGRTTATPMETMKGLEAVKDDDVVNFKASICARRDLLQHLFEYALKRWEDVQTLSKRSHEIHEKRTDRSVVRPGKEIEARDAARQLDSAQWAAQDSANALMLIVGYSLERFLAAVWSRPLERKDLHDALKTLGFDAYHGVKLGSAIVALGDLARHLHEPQAEPPKRLKPRTKEVLDALCLGETHNEAAAQFLQNLQKNNPAFQSYDDFARALLRIADDA
jgi:hypothetical protein